MIIQVDKEGLDSVQKLVDIALKSGGLQNLQGVSIILNSVKMLEEAKPQVENKQEDSPEDGD
jgi:hypothetical protein